MRFAGRRGWHLRVLLVVAVALTLRLLTAGHGVMTADEHNWLYRSERFENALRAGDFDRASASDPDNLATRPGITTMWVGVTGRMIGHVLLATDLTDRPLTPGGTSSLALQLSQIVMAVVSSGLIGVVVLLGRNPLGAPAALITGLLLAVEPWVVAHNSVIHTDGLVTLALAASMLALLSALGWGRTRPPTTRRAVRTAALAGIFLAVAMLTKLNALLFIPGMPVIGAAAVASGLWRARRPAVGTNARRDREAEGTAADGDGDATHRPSLGDTVTWARAVGVLAVTGGVALVAFVALYPALWSNPGPELDALTTSAEMGGAGHRQFFLGEITTNPGAAFYPVSLLVRLSPWLMAAVVAGVVLAVAKRISRSLVALLIAVPLPYVVAMTLGSKKFDRYMLPVVPFLAMVGALAVAWLWCTQVIPRVRPVPRAAVAGVVTACLALPTLALRPDTLAYVNPLAAAGNRAERTVLIGWGEGIERFARRIAEEEEGDCDDVVVATGNHHSEAAFPCGTLERLQIDSEADLAGVDYVILYPMFTQRDIGGARAPAILEDNATVVMDLELGGVDYGRLYRVDG